MIGIAFSLGSVFGLFSVVVFVPFECIDWFVLDVCSIFVCFGGVVRI